MPLFYCNFILENAENLKIVNCVVTILFVFKNVENGNVGLYDNKKRESMMEADEKIC